MKVSVKSKVLAALRKPKTTVFESWAVVAPQLPLLLRDLVAPLVGFAGDEIIMARVVTTTTIPDRYTQTTWNLRVRTRTRQYQIEAVIPVMSDNPNAPPLMDGYLGARYSNLMPEPGETWTRGRDLVDGAFNSNTFSKILVGIVAAEMVPFPATDYRTVYLTSADVHGK